MILETASFQIFRRCRVTLLELAGSDEMQLKIKNNNIIYSPYVKLLQIK